MFLNLWSKSRNGDVVQDKINLKSPGSPYLGLSHATSSPQKLKRKRDEGSPVFSQLELPPFKRRIETMSHVEVPSNDLQRVALSPSFAQAIAKGPPLPAIPSSTTSASASQQTDAFDGRVENTVSPPGGTVSKMDRRDHLDDQDNNQAVQLPAGTDQAALRDTIESQFNLEILLKHKELRLIDQEIAKCQIGLEQLRRCTIIPYPAMSSNLSNMQAVSDGSGPVYHSSAPHAPPWGVTNGPYGQHYAHWLLQDPAFGDTITDEQTSSASHPLGDRTGRGVRQERQTIANNSRSSRGTSGGKLTALPDGYPVAKEEKGPCIVIRSSDKKKVKLVCLDPSCRRSDFNSTQGFINHCRIQHSRAFASHDAAINQCGEEIDEDAEAGNNERGGSQGGASVGLVHPYVRLAFSPAGLPSPISSALAQSSKRRKPSTAFVEPTLSPAEAASSHGGKTMQVSAQSKFTANNIDGNEGPKQPLKPSSDTPYLSKLVARLGKGGDLDDMVKQATTKADVDFEQFSDEDEDEEMGNTESEALQSEPMVKTHSSHGGMRPSASSQVNTSNAARHPGGTDGACETPKAIGLSNHQARYSSPFSMKFEQSASQENAAMLDVNTPFNLSPNSTDPHPAPSLVSDDGDGDYENLHSDSESPSDMGDDRIAQHEPQVMDHDGLDLGENSSLSMGHAKQHHHHDHHGPTSEIVAVTRRSRVAGGSTSVNRTNGERHVSFQSPSKKLSKGSKAKNSK